MGAPSSWRRLPLILATACALLAGTAAADAEEPAADPNAPPGAPAEEAPPASVGSIEERVRTLEREAGIEKEKAAAAAKEAVKVTAGREGFSIQSADGAFAFRLRGYAQFDGRFFSEDAGKPATSTFLMRRVRPLFEGTIYRYFDFRIMPDFGDGRTVLQDAYIEARVKPAFRVRGGKYKTPFGLERLQSATDLLFPERALPTALVPNRDEGLMLSGDVAGGILQYAVGAFNGVPDGGSADTDVDDGKDAAARLFAQPFKKAHVGFLEGLGVGIAGTSGTQGGSPTATGLAPYRTAGQQTFFAWRSATAPTSANTVFADGRRTRLSPQAYWSWRRGSLLAERVTSRQEVRRGGLEATIDNRSWQIAGSLLLTDDKPSYRGVSPKKPIGVAQGGGIGAIELAARWNVLTVDEAAFPFFADPEKSAREARAWGAGVNWYLNRGLKAMVSYEETAFRGGDAAGDRPKEKALFTRLQISF